jgi:hypothetical protein
MATSNDLLYVLMFRFDPMPKSGTEVDVVGARIKSVERALDGSLEVTDWFRYNALTWFVAGRLSAERLVGHVRQHVAAEDAVVAIRLHDEDFWGEAPEAVWDWLRRHGEVDVTKAPPRPR